MTVGTDIVLNLDRPLLAQIIYTGMEIGAIFAPRGNVPQSLEPPPTRRAKTEGRKSDKTSPRKSHSRQTQSKPPTHGKLSPEFQQVGEDKIPVTPDVPSGKVSSRHHRHRGEHHRHHSSALIHSQLSNFLYLLFL